MDKINFVQSWSRYNNKVQALQQTLGLSALQKSEKKELDSKWVTYDSQVQTLKKKLEMYSLENSLQLTFHKPGSKQADDSTGKPFVSGNLYRTGRELNKEILRQYGQSAVHSLAESYLEGTMKKSHSAPKQEVVDKVLIRRSLAHADHMKDLNEAIRKLEAAKGHLKKKLKNLEAQNEFFGNGQPLQATGPHMLSLSYDPRKEPKSTNPLGSDFLKGLEMDDPLMDDIIKEVMSANFSYQPQKRDPAITERIQKLKLESSRDHVILLTEEEIILEVTSEMSKIIAQDVFKRMALNTEFDSHFDSTKVQEYLKNTNPLNF
ncbi:uncharacterized protein [Aquarana catesbeiana]|uniref:uncharacterized protein isoform X1 n=1 Tax=Aquarana catesbeiana TaxID=8400 RepID=UPI003CCA46C4